MSLNHDKYAKELDKMQEAECDFEGWFAVALEDLVKAGYTLYPEKLGQ